jgi:hypothetical protein
LAFPSTFSLTPDAKVDRKLTKCFSSRREALAVGIGFTSALIVQSPALAFANKISNKYDDRPKRRGPQVHTI